MDVTGVTGAPTGTEDATAQGARSALAALVASGVLAERAAALEARLSSCDLCPRECRVDRRRRAGACRTGEWAHLAAAVAHRGEEPVLSGTRGSGTLFVTGCNLSCVFCQNHQVSHPEGDGAANRGTSPEELGAAMLRLAAAGCHNINLVSASHVVPQVLRAVAWAVAHGLALPIVWNSNGFEKVDVLRALAGVVSIYLPDMKYGGDAMARRLSGVTGYVAASRAALREMDRQVGPLVVDDDGVAVRGLIVRHLVLPHNAAATSACVRYIAEHLSPGVAVSLMSQYAPAFRAFGHPIVGRRITAEEYERAVALLAEAGLEVGFVQDPEESPDHYRPDFALDHPFES